MTTASPTPIIPTEADKALLLEIAKHIDTVGGGAARYGVGPIWQIIARHALSARMEALEEAAKMADAMWATYSREPIDWYYGGQEASVGIANAIRSLIPTGAA